ncbi:hypothetical protein GCM10025886_14900 [Tetragenococcus halophilus subsp. flandriensis]|uniref:alpha-amylase n=1 Tax=Tetragenococcus halophilus TaxID=51669 RepID=UPI0023E945AF|nr:alpha-amylase [Tetragenococcus halophilus]GMA08339.1 hypothetical protein GCM10025886_14900 [Tetragenococcus halophilus subsp. flandriensis]
MAENYVIMQAFEWYLENDGNYYKWLKEEVQKLSENGIDALWLPPLCKATNTDDIGYGIYDLGDFDQKGDIRTKYGTVDELKAAIEALHGNDIKVYADIIMNHKAGADFTEEMTAIEVDENDRNHEVSEPHTIESWTGFNFPARNGKYSDFEWNHHHFSGVDFDQKEGKTAIFKIIGENKHWADGVSDEKGNYDYLMFADIDYKHPDVHDELLKWGSWLVDYIQIDGMRFDALKHIQDAFIVDFIKYVEETSDRHIYFFGEYWVYDKNKENSYLYQTKYHTDLFDVALHYHLAEASTNAANYDMRKVFDNTLVQEHPGIAVTFVDNHDSQPGQSLESFVQTLV